MQTPLDPDIAAVLPKLPDWNVPGQTAQGARDLLTAIAQSRKDLPLPQPHSIENRVIEEAIEVRIYRGALTAAPTIVFFHGGGFVAGDLDTHDRQARWLAVDVGAVVVSVHYRRPPEAKFPAAFDDALAVTRWAAAHVAELGGLPGALGVAGDSAGGNLAAAVAIACRDQGLALAAQLLVYPVTDCAGVYRDANDAYPSREQNREGYFLTLAVMRWFCEQYFVDSAQGRDPRASPMHCENLAGLAPAVVCTAQYDPLRDEGIAYAARLRRAGVVVREHFGAGLIHGYFGMVDSIASAAEEGRKVRADFAELLRQGAGLY
ncbi:MAG: alpha/beta hydrolase [Quisquiliibacterium sp.]